MKFYHSREILKTSIEYRTRSLKTASKKVVHNAGEFLGNEIADTVTKSNDDNVVKPAENPRNVE